MEALMRTMRARTAGGETVLVDEYQEFGADEATGVSSKRHIGRLQLRTGQKVVPVNDRKLCVEPTGERLTII